MKKIAASILALGLLAAPAAAPAQAATGVKLGMLVCDVSGSIGLILGGTEAASCTFQGPNGPDFLFRTWMTPTGDPSRPRSGQVRTLRAASSGIIPESPLSPP